MISRFIRHIVLLSVLIFTLGETSWAQFILPLDSVENLIIIRGQKSIKPSSKKKSIAVVVSWSGEKKAFPPMVFSTIHESKNRIVLKAVTDVPSIKGIHPVSFKLDILISRKSFRFRADNFYFEDITLSLEEWLEKYESSENERHIRNVEMIGKEIDSYIFLTMEDLKKRINDQ